MTASPYLRVALLMSALASPAFAETSEIRLAQQFGISYLPMEVMQDQKLIERFVKQAGLPEPKVSWNTFGGGNVMNDALISDSLDYASGGIGPLLTLWSRTRGNSDVRAVSSLNSMPLYLNTVNPAVKSIKDLTENDKIALPAVKVSIQAVTLQMAAEQAFGPGQQNRLDSLTVSMAHPDAMAAMMSGKSEVTSHFGSAPFQYQQLKDPRIHRVLNSYEVLGGPHTFNVIWTTAKFRTANPVTYKAVLEALQEAMSFIKKDPKGAAALYIRMEKSKLDPAFVEQMIQDPENVFTITPENTMKYADFLSRTGQIKVKPADWKELFFPDIHDLKGS